MITFNIRLFFIQRNNKIKRKKTSVPTEFFLEFINRNFEIFLIRNNSNFSDQVLPAVAILDEKNENFHLYFSLKSSLFKISFHVNTPLGCGSLKIPKLLNYF